MSNTATATPLAPPEYFENLVEHAFSPGWAKKEPQMWATPRPRHVATVWRYAQARQALDQACSFVSPEFAERRNLILVNPIPGNVYPTCRNLVGAYQLVLPGETARSHRHSPNALRLILDAGPETFTIVDGVRVDVAEGDVVLTPSWSWHGHSNFGDRPAFWLDFLDVPLVQNLENMYFEDHPERHEVVRSIEPDSALRCRGTAIDALVREKGEVEILAGGLKTIGLHAIGLKAGESRGAEMRIDNNIFAVTRGEASIVVDGLGSVKLGRGDVVVVPCWHTFSITGLSDWSQMIRVTDEPVFKTLGFRDVTR